MKLHVKIVRFILSMLLIVVCCSSLRVDDLKDQVKTVFSKMENYYEKNDNFSLDITYQAKKENRSGKLLELTKGVYHQYKTDEYFFEVNNIITIVQDEIMLVVDKNTKNLLLTEKKKNQNLAFNLSTSDWLDMCSNIVHKNNHIDFIFSNSKTSPYFKASLSYNPIDYSLTTLVLYPKQLYSMKKNEREFVNVKTVLEVHYQQYDSNEVDKTKTSISTYINKSNNNYKPHEDYSKYEFINQLK